MVEEVCVHCDTEEEFMAVKKKKRGDGNGNGWHDLVAGKQADTVNDNGYGWANRSYYEKEGSTIIPASEYLKGDYEEYLKDKEFKVGDRVEWPDNFSGTIYHIDGDVIHTKRDDGEGGSGKDGTWVAPRDELIKLSTNQPKTTKKEEKEMNKIIKDVFEEESSKVAQVINDEYGDEVSNTFSAAPKLGVMFVEDHKVGMIAHAKKVIADAKKAAEKAAKEADK